MYDDQYDYLYETFHSQHVCDLVSIDEYPVVDIISHNYFHIFYEDKENSYTRKERESTSFLRNHPFDKIL